MVKNLRPHIRAFPPLKNKTKQKQKQNKTKQNKKNRSGPKGCYLDLLLFMILLLLVAIALAYETRDELRSSGCQGDGAKGRAVQGNQWSSPPASMTSRLASSKRRIKMSILSAEIHVHVKYCSDALDLEILRSLLSYKTRLKYFFGMKRPVAY